ncbi:MAG: gamma-glutamylcyclotransferase [Pseudomonadota bacterium]
MSAHNRLATYGTLAPGRVNHHQVSELSGEWKQGVVRGQLVEEGWGADHGCPGIILDHSGDPVEVFIFESPDLPNHWARLDEFEGAEYSRTEVCVEMEDGTVDAFIYALSPSLRTLL